MESTKGKSETGGGDEGEKIAPSVAQLPYQSGLGRVGHPSRDLFQLDSKLFELAPPQTLRDLYGIHVLRATRRQCPLGLKTTK
jgi:hypothetical protein